MPWFCNSLFCYGLMFLSDRGGLFGVEKQADLGQYITAGHCHQMNVLNTLRCCHVFIVQISFGPYIWTLKSKKTDRSGTIHYGWLLSSNECSEHSKML
jgi:hypothetical protein